MSVIYILIPLGLILMGVMVWGILWAVRSQQFEDLEGPAHRVLMDDDDPRIPHRTETSRAATHETEPSRDADSP
jgi:cbb3-type cytochrome oxidase maturation protein